MANVLERKNWLIKQHPQLQRQTGFRIAALLLMLGGCGLLDPEPEFPWGSFPLAAIDGRPLPIDQRGVPTRFGEPSSCRSILDEGFLSLDPQRGRYDLHYHVRSSCDQHILSTVGQTGTYTQQGAQLTFEIASLDRNRYFSGTDREHSIEVQFNETAMRFSKPPLPAQSRLSGGAYSLMDVGGQPLPVAGAGNAGLGCPLLLTSASIVLEPDPTARIRSAPATGYFSARSTLSDSCTGRPAHHLEERGVYEEIAQAVYFEAYREPNIFRSFRGIVRSDEWFDVTGASYRR